MIIREFKKSDREGIIEVLKEVWSISKVEDNILEEWMTDNYNFVALIDGEIVGTLTLHTQRKLIRDGGISGFIEDVAVKEKYRGKNIGSMLVQKGIEKAREIGCYKIILSCFPERVSFYEKNGFFKESITMRIEV